MRVGRPWPISVVVICDVLRHSSGKTAWEWIVCVFETVHEPVFLRHHCCRGLQICWVELYYRLFPSCVISKWKIVMPPLSFLMRHCLVNPAAARMRAHTHTHTHTHTHISIYIHTHTILPLILIRTVSLAPSPSLSPSLSLSLPWCNQEFYNFRPRNSALHAFLISAVTELNLMNWVCGKSFAPQ